MAKLSDWASSFSKGTGVASRPVVPNPTPAHRWPQPAQPAPMPQPVAFEPAGPARHPTLVSPTGQAHPRQIWTPAPQPAQTCSIVKVDANDPYARFLASLPDLTAGNDLTGGYDAMALPGVPEGAAMEKWKGTTQRTYGGRDCDAKVQLAQYTQSRYGTGSFQGGLVVTGGGGTGTKPTGG